MEICPGDEDVGVYLFLNAGTAGGILAGMSWSLGVNGVVTVVPTITGKQPDAGFFAQVTPVRTEFVEQNGAEHHIAIFATLAALDMNHHVLGYQYR